MRNKEQEAQWQALSEGGIVEGEGHEVSAEPAKRLLGGNEHHV